MSKTKTKSLHWTKLPLPNKYKLWRRAIASKVRVAIIEEYQGDWKAFSKKAKISLPTVKRFLEYKTMFPNIYTLWRMCNGLSQHIDLEVRKGIDDVR